MSAVWLARMPILRHFCPWESPAVSPGTTNAETPWKPVPGSSVAKMTLRSAMPPQVMKRLLPLRT